MTLLVSLPTEGLLGAGAAEGVFFALELLLSVESGVVRAQRASIMGIKACLMLRKCRFQLILLFGAGYKLALSFLRSALHATPL